MKNQQQGGKIGKTPGRERKTPLNPSNQNNFMQSNNNVMKRAPMKENKQISFKQNLSSAFSNISKIANNNVINAHQQNNIYGINNWVPPTSTANANIWNNNTSYSEVVAQPVEPKMQQSISGMMNGTGTVNGHRHEHDFARISNFNRMNDQSYNIEQDMSNSTQYGPIGTRKSPSSTPSWEPLNGGMNQHIAKPSPYSASSFFSSQPGMQQSKLMHLMSYNETALQQQMINEQQYQYMLKMKERQQMEWMNGTSSNTSAGSLWSSSSSNWATPSPPPGFEQQFQHAQNQHQVQPAQSISANQQQSSLPAYDPFNSLSAIWNPSNRNDNERDAWNQ